MNGIKKYLAPLLTGAIVLSLSSCASILANPKSNGESVAEPSPTQLSSADPTSLPTSQTLDTSLTTELDSTASTPEKLNQETSVTSQPLNATDSKTTSTAKSLKTVNVTIYQANNQCESLVAEKVDVPAENPAQAAVGKVLKQADSGDFDLAGYRVKVNPESRVATVDFRLSPNSKRQFSSLSSCEQFAMFGSLRKTLTDNTQLKIKNVRFTNQGAEIAF